jgi:hypothetical protein
MTNREWMFGIIGTVAVTTMMLVSVDITINKFEPKPLKDKRIKCVDGDLCEEVRPHLFIKSHLNCFEEGKFNSR